MRSKILPEGERVNVLFEELKIALLSENKELRSIAGRQEEVIDDLRYRLSEANSLNTKFRNALLKHGIMPGLVAARPLENT